MSARGGTVWVPPSALVWSPATQPWGLASSKPKYQGRVDTPSHMWPSPPTPSAHLVRLVLLAQGRAQPGLHLEPATQHVCSQLMPASAVQCGCIGACRHTLCITWSMSQLCSPSSFSYNSVVCVCTASIPSSDAAPITALMAADRPMRCL